MSTTELKKNLIHKINATDDEALLWEASRLLDLQLDIEEEPFELSEDMNTAIDEATEQLKRGESLDHDAANKEVSKWLEE